MLGIALMPVLTLTLGSAAAIPVTVPSIAASASAVNHCDDDGTPVYSYTVVYDTTDDRYEVSTVKVEDISSSCNGASLLVTLADADGTSIASGGPVEISGTTASVTVSPWPASSSVAQSHLVIVGP